MMRLYLRGCEREWKSLAKSLRDAAKAYEEVDEGAADAIQSGAILDITPAAVSENDNGGVPGGAFVAPDPLPMSAAFDYPDYEVRQAVMDIENGDQGAAFTAFAGCHGDDFQRSFCRTRPSGSARLPPGRATPGRRSRRISNSSGSGYSGCTGRYRARR